MVTKVMVHVFWYYCKEYETIHDSLFRLIYYEGILKVSYINYTVGLGG